MPSILSGNTMPSGTNNNPLGAVKNIVDQIMCSSNPQAAFQQMLNSSPDCKNAMNLIQQYGNGDPRQAFMNYASQTGKLGIAQQILSKLGLQ